MRRKEDWPEKLNEFIASRASKPFAWGTNDCCMFACDDVLVLVGIDPAAETYRGKYDSALGAKRLFDSSGGVERIAEDICKREGFEECPVPFAGRGDVVLMDMTKDGAPETREKADGCALGVCVGAVAAFVGPEGLVYHKLKHCRRAWRIF